MSNNYGAPPDNYGTPYSTYNTQDQHELQNYPQTSRPAASSGVVLSQQDFLSRTSDVRNEIRTLATDVQRISQLHQAALSGSDDSAQRRLDDLVASTQHRNNSIRDQLRSLKADVEQTPLNFSGANTKKSQWEVLNRDFQKELQGYLQEEQSFKARYREQIERQYRIVNPDAGEDEVKRAAEMDWGSEGVFQSALRSNRTGQANAVLGNVRARHNELLDIERSINELVILIQDLDTMVIQQAPAVEAAEEHVNNVANDLEGGNKEVDGAIKKVLATRKKKWICTGIVVLIILGIALGVGLGVGLTTGKISTGNSSGNSTKRSVEELDQALVVRLTELPVMLGLDL
ncbi:hypothetical protein N0V93_000789 [Gnomoniopsis smithogilvyi]|uniref:t-SNARE coiled-coil homology domain-containing protein n=1 Tax=Gnomoniopsis smithogilvyi TaxID=1191159 RepID=A0A9W8Z4B8_9PEZI|nr:hypothetical protein N0V93_000789 [Gnomoniopsis smithogilvyi]